MATKESIISAMSANAAKTATGSIANSNDFGTQIDAFNYLNDKIDAMPSEPTIPVAYDKDIVSVSSYSSLPATGDVTKLYLTTDTSKVYTWNGTAYEELAQTTTIVVSSLATLPTLSLEDGSYTAILAITGNTGNTGECRMLNYVSKAQANRCYSALAGVGMRSASRAVSAHTFDGTWANGLTCKTYTTSAEAVEACVLWQSKGVNLQTTADFKCVYNLTIETIDETTTYKLSNENGFATWSGTAWEWNYYAYDNDLTYKADKCYEVAQTTNATIQPNTRNVWGEVTTLTITKGTDLTNDEVSEYVVVFTATATTAITWIGFTLSWAGGSAPTYTSGKKYEISIVDNLAAYLEI